MDVERLADPEACAQRAAAFVAEAIAGGAHNVTLAGGSSPMRSYELMGGLVADWSGVHLWYGDERCVPYDHPDSNHGQALARLDATGATWHPMPAELGPIAGAERYAQELDGTLLDVTMLGMGPDGHTASLFPSHPLLDAQVTVAGITDSPKPPPERITLTLPALNASSRILLLVSGAEKHEALQRVLTGPDRGTPASLLARDRLLVIADAAALG